MKIERILPNDSSHLQKGALAKRCPLVYNTCRSVSAGGCYEYTIGPSLQSESESRVEASGRARARVLCWETLRSLAFGIGTPSLWECRPIRKESQLKLEIRNTRLIPLKMPSVPDLVVGNMILRFVGWMKTFIQNK
eukprot:scaffold12118_cov135-Skeletonema_marinoi.AAC.1